MRTSSTLTPSVKFNACVTRRTHEPQCIPSMRSMNSGILFSPFNLMILGLIRCMNAGLCPTRYASVRWPSMLEVDKCPN